MVAVAGGGGVGAGFAAAEGDRGKEIGREDRGWGGATEEGHVKRFVSVLYGYQRKDAQLLYITVGMAS